MRDSLITEWREAGYKVIFRDPIWYLVRWPKSDVVIQAHKKDAPLNCPNVNEAPWHKMARGLADYEDHFANDLRRIAENCYCGHAGVEYCDFCSGLRQVQ